MSLVPEDDSGGTLTILKRMLVGKRQKTLEGTILEQATPEDDAGGTPKEKVTGGPKASGGRKMAPGYRG